MTHYGNLRVEDTYDGLPESAIFFSYAEKDGYIELRTYLLKEMDIAQDFALEMIEDAREPEEVDECECE